MRVRNEVIVHFVPSTVAIVIVACSLLGSLGCKRPSVKKQPATAQEAIQTMQERLQASIVRHRTKQPAAKDVEGTIEYGKAQRERFPDDDDLTQALVAMMFQSLQFLQDDPPKLAERRLEVGALARTLASKPEVVRQTKDTLSFIFLEESKAHIQQKDLEASWNSILDSRKLGFQQSKLFYFEPAFQPIVQNEVYGPQVNAWLAQEIDGEIARQEAFPLSLSLTSLEDVEPGTEPKAVSLENFQDKKLILLDLWGTWCAPCRAAVPQLVKIQDRFSDDLAVVGVTFEQPIGSASLEVTKARLDEVPTSRSQ